MSQPLLRRTWAPWGQASVRCYWRRHYRLSVSSAIMLVSHRCRLGLCWSLHQHDIPAEDVLSFLQSLRKNLRQKIIVIMGRWSVHKAMLPEFLEKHSKSICVEWLPRYAPEFNPVEQVWSHSKYADMANLALKNVEGFDLLVRSSLSGAGDQSYLPRSFFQKAGLAV